MLINKRRKMLNDPRKVSRTGSWDTYTDYACSSVIDEIPVEGDYSRYDDPVEFGENVLGEQYTDDIKRLMRSVRDYPVTIAKSGNATGKSHSAARICIWFYKRYGGLGDDCKVYTTAAPPKENMDILWGEIGNVYRKNKSVFEGDIITSRSIVASVVNSRTGKRSITEEEDESGSFIKGVTIPSTGGEKEREAKFSGKHAPYMMFVLDEADAVPDPVYKGIESCISGGFTRVLCMFNPRHESGEVYRWIRDGRANVVHLSALNHPNVLTGEDKIPGAVTRNQTVSRINKWTRPLMPGEETKDIFTVPDFLVGVSATDEKGNLYPPLPSGDRKIVDSCFSYMVCGEYPSQSTKQLISREWIQAARDRWDRYVSLYGEIPPQNSLLVIGHDVAEYGDDKNVICDRYGGYVAQFETWEGVDIAVSADKSVSHYRSRKGIVQRCNVDATGVGAGIPPLMVRQGCIAHAIKVAERPTQKCEMGEFNRLRDQLYWAVREWLKNDPSAMLPPNEYLEEELRCPTYENKNGKICVMSKDDMRETLKRSPDYLDALMLTFADPKTPEVVFADD